MKRAILIAIVALGLASSAPAAHRDDRDGRYDLELTRTAHQLERETRQVYDLARRYRGSSQVRRSLDRLAREARQFHRRVENDSRSALRSVGDFRELTSAYCNAAASLHGARRSAILYREFDQVDALMDRLFATYGEGGCGYRDRRYDPHGEVYERDRIDRRGEHDRDDDDHDHDYDHDYDDDFVVIHGD